jgi:hypothetical protein
MIAVLYFAAGTVVVLLAALAADQLRLRKHRGVSREEFISSFAEASVSPDIPPAVYDYYVAQAIWKEYGAAADDTYEHVLRKAEEDIDDDARALTKLFGLKMPSRSAMADQPKIRTIGDMVRWLDWARRIERSSGSSGSSGRIERDSQSRRTRKSEKLAR